MSYHHRRRHPKADDYDRREYSETPEQKLRKIIIHYGEVDPIQELPRVASQIFEHTPINIPVITEGFRIGVTEQPFKIPYYAALLCLLYGRSVPEGEGPPLGKQVLEDFWKGFQAFVVQYSLREMRLCVQFFAHLTVARVVSTQSLYQLLSVLSSNGMTEFHSYDQSSAVAVCIAEALMIAGAVMKEDSLKIEELRNAVATHINENKKNRTLAQPVVQLHSVIACYEGKHDKFVLEHAEEWTQCALAALDALIESDFANIADSVLQPYLESPPLADSLYDLPIVTVPAVFEDEDENAPIKKGGWPQCYVRLFDDDVTPDPTTPAGFILRSNLIDMVNIFEVNRKECARLLLEYPKWTLSGTFKARPGAPAQPEVEGKGWDLENTLLETILGAMFGLAESTHKAVYYIALITELCKSSPQTVGPAVGKSIRKLYALLGDGLDVEIAHRYADWFAVHMSNFGFVWVWKEWIPDLALVPQHPKRGFMRRAVEYEIRLSYHDRILRMLPEAMAERDVQVIPNEAPGPEFEYEEPENSQYEAAQGVLNLLRGRAKPDDVIAHLQTLRNSLSETVEGDVNVNSLIRSITVQSLLSIGSRSFSHFLNAIERYLPLLRNLAAGQISSWGSPHADARADIMSAVARVWKRSRHMVVIVFDKLMQYQIVDPTDVIAWTFTSCPLVMEGRAKSTFNAFQWDLLKSALDKANGRVTVQRKKVAALRREADDRAARAIAGETANMEVDDDAQQNVAPAPAGETPQLTAATKAFSILTREQEAALKRAFEGFLDCLAVENVDPNVHEVITEHAWHNRANWEDDAWESWQTWGWYRHWSRAYSPYLKREPFKDVLEALADEKVPVRAHAATTFFRETWNCIVGADL